MSVSRTDAPRVASDVRHLFQTYLWALVGVSLLLGVLHVAFSDLRAGGVAWFDLDKERNLATWFSGSLFFLFGCSALLAYATERRRNADGSAIFKLPLLWVGVAIVGLYMSLDEITILHENLFWREVRIASSQRSDAFKYVTQWQIVFAPAILLGAAYMVVFFTNRFGASRAARRASWAGLGCWFAALLLEGVRGTFLQSGSQWYGGQVVVEEQLEMLGAIFLFAAIVSYVIDITFDLTKGRRRELARAEHWLNRRSWAGLSVIVAVLMVSAGVVFLFATRQAESGAPVPGLFRRAIADQPRGSSEPQRAGRPPDLPEGSAPDVWFDDVALSAPWPRVSADEQARAFAAYLFGRTPPTAGALDRDTAPRIAYLSVSDGRSPARTYQGQGKGLREAIRRAASAASVEGADPSRWVRLDVVEQVDTEDRFDFRPPLAMELGIHGLAFERRSTIALLPGEIQGHQLINEKREIQPRQLLNFLQAKDSELARRFTAMVQPGVANPYRFFSTRGFVLEGERLIPLYRGHKTYASVDPALLRDAARRAADYLIRATGPDGRFVYSFDPSLDTAADDYNMLRHAGTVYSMLEVYAGSRDAPLLDAIERASAYLASRLRPCPERENSLCVVDSGAVKLGGNALAAIAFVEYANVTGNAQYEQLLPSLASWIRDTQATSGEFLVHKQAVVGGAVSDFVSGYYPGEAILALVRVYERTGDVSFLDAAERAARWLITVRDGGLPPSKLNHDHWLLYALNDLYRNRPDPIQIEHTRKIVQAIVEFQKREPKQPDWLGSYYEPPRSTPTAIRTEGLAAACALLRDHGRPGEVAPIVEAIRLGLRFDLQTQIGPELAMYFKNPARALGGVSRGLTGLEVRIDYVQHSISAMLAGADILEK